MITVQQTNETVSVKNLDKVLYNEELIKQLARTLVAGHVECHIDMAQDMGDEIDEIGTYADAECHLKAAQSSVEDYMADLLTEFRDSLYNAVRSCKIDVKSIKLSKDGLDDADVHVS